MALPKDQIANLRGRLKNHLERIRELKKQISSLETESKAHQTIVTLMGDKKVLALLGELFDDRAKAKSLAGKELNFVKQAGITLPPKSKLTFFDGPNDSLRIRLDVPNSGGMPYYIQWDSLMGFGPVDPD
jgi:hypothetical protein